MWLWEYGTGKIVDPEVADGRAIILLLGSANDDAEEESCGNTTTVTLLVPRVGLKRYT